MQEPASWPEGFDPDLVETLRAIKSRWQEVEQVQKPAEARRASETHAQLENASKMAADLAAILYDMSAAARHYVTVVSIDFGNELHEAKQLQMAGKLETLSAICAAAAMRIETDFGRDDVDNVKIVMAKYSDMKMLKPGVSLYLPGVYFSSPKDWFAIEAIFAMIEHGFLPAFKARGDATRIARWLSAIWCDGTSKNTKSPNWERVIAKRADIYAAAQEKMRSDAAKEAMRDELRSDSRDS